MEEEEEVVVDMGGMMLLPDTEIVEADLALVINILQGPSSYGLSFLHTTHMSASFL